MAALEERLHACEAEKNALRDVNTKLNADIVKMQMRINELLSMIKEYSGKVKVR